MDKFEERSAIVTGAANRIGRAIALALAERGFNIGLHFYQSKETASATSKEIESLGRKCLLLNYNLTQSDSAYKLMQDANKHLPNIDLLVNNASIFKAGNLLQTSAELFDLNFAVHVRAAFFLTSEFAKLFGKGQVINIVDAAIVKHRPEYFAYLLSKKTLYEFTKMSAQELAPEIRVNAIAPGSTLEPIDSPGDGYLEFRASQVPLKMAGNPNYLITGIDYLLANPFVTGQCLFIDGGAHIEV